jgi:peroxiredoxin
MLRTLPRLPPDPARGRSANIVLVIGAGASAPDFELPDQDGELVRLSALRGRTIVLYFYPKADTPGCTTQACSIRDRGAEYTAAGVKVIGVSPDPVKKSRSSTRARS